MSEDDQKRNIAEAVIALQGAKQHLAQIEASMVRVAAASRELSQTLISNLGLFYETQLVDGKIRFGLSNSKSDPSALVDERGLVALLTERDQARAAIEEAKRKLCDLGFGSVG